MNPEKWEEAKHEILKNYYIELYGEEPQDTRCKEYKNGNVAKGRVLRRIDICIEIFERSLRKLKQNKRRCIVLELPELSKRDRLFLEHLIIKFVMQGRLSTPWVREIDLDEILDEDNENKKELNSAVLAICDVDGHHGNTIPESKSSTGSN